MTGNAFENKTVLITGGASGIGLATAREFARVGANVVVDDMAV
ncbi:MAG TPA: SDR family NAD(P)-dependent oxidoreductase [Desulfotignum sp.]|nr:SDR family NAD(P)-dependent oxidoreductase [Desulfotignum sp.]